MLYPTLSLYSSVPHRSSKSSLLLIHFRITRAYHLFSLSVIPNSLSIALFLIVLPNHLLFRLISESFEPITSSLLPNDAEKLYCGKDCQRARWRFRTLLSEVHPHTRISD
ncbi:hypothetical protein ACSBR2_004582 [Camellia fascicularis]